MGLNFYEVQQKIDRLIQNQSELFKRHRDLFFSPDKKDVTIKQVDEHGDTVDLTLPNYSKVMSMASPIGSIILWPGQDVPEGWMECNGKTVKRNDFLLLFDIAKKGDEQPQEPFKTGDAVNTFGLPDFTKNAFPGTKYIIRVK